MKVFLETKNRIAKHNAEYELGLQTFKLGMNKFGDLVSTISSTVMSIPVLQRCNVWNQHFIISNKYDICPSRR